MPIVLATVLSRPLGFLRMAIQAALFGKTAAVDAFVLAFSVPSILQVVLLTGPLSSLLAPTLTAYRDDRRALSELFSSLFTLCALGGLLIAGVAAWAAPALLSFAGPGLAPDTRALAVLLFRLMLPMLVMQALLSVCKGALNTLAHYAAPEFAGAVFNVVMITTALLLAAHWGIVGLAVGASLGSVAQLIMQWPVLIRYGIRYWPRVHLDTRGRQMARLARGAFVSAMVTPLNALVDRALASLLFAGAIAALHYAFQLFLLPVSLCVVPLSTVLLTDLAGLYHKGDIAALRQRAGFGLRLILLLTIPVAIGGALLAAPLTRLAYEYGRFHAADTLLTAQALRAYLLGLPFYGTTHVLTRCFYATQDTMTPALVNLGAFGLNVICDLLLMHFFSHWGIALASTIVMLATTIALYVLFQRHCALLSLRAIGPPGA